MSFFRNAKGFTLVELIVVITVIGILTGGVAMSISGNAERARDTRRKTDLQQIKAALEFYRSNNDQGYYPSIVSSVTPNRRWWSNPGGAGIGYVLEAHGYMEELPSDPLTNKKNDYVYTPSPAGCQNRIPIGDYCTSYTLTATEMETEAPYVVSPTSVD